MNKKVEYIGAHSTPYGLWESPFVGDDATLYAAPEAFRHFAHCTAELPGSPERRERMGEIARR